MGLRDILSGRNKLKSPAEDRLFALSTARVTLDMELGLKSAGAGGIVFKPLSAGEFVRAENDLQQVLDAVAAESGSRLERKSDDYGYEWIVVRDAELEDQITTVHAVAQGLEEAGFGERLLAAAFKFEPKFGDAKTRLLGVWLQAGGLLAVRPDRREGARQRRGARAEGEARQRAADRA
jgi:hypothetical protein